MRINFSGDSPLRKLQIAEMAVKNLYVDSVDEQKLVEDAIRGMLEKLDPHSSYADPEEVKALNEPLQGNFEGIGVQFNMVDDTLLVIQPVSKGPSEKVGIMAGDRIVSVNDTAIAGVNADAVADAYDGAEASLFDDGSATVRLAAFVFLCRLGASSAERSDQVWPLIDEAIQCYHGDAEYRDMLAALLGLARGAASDATKAALAARVRFDAESGSGYIKSFSAEILQAAE